VKTIHETEVVVIGGGVVGCSIAFHLAKRGKHVILVDKNAPATGTSVACSGLVGSTFKFPHHYIDLSLKSCLLWPKMVEELGVDVGYRRGKGMISLCLTEEIYEKYAAWHQEHLISPLYRGRMMSAAEVREIQPGVAPDIAGAHINENDGECDVNKFMYGLVRGCKQAGVKMMRNSEVTSFDLGENGQVKGVIINNEYRINTPVAVNAAGIWATKVAKMVGLDIDVYPDRGQVFITEPAPIICPEVMHDVGQFSTGQFHMGGAHELVGFDTAVTLPTLEDLTKKAIKFVPKIADLSVIRHFSGMRPMPRDRFPYMGSVPRLPGYYIAVGHSGFTLAAIYGKVFGDLIVDGHTDIPIGEYDPMRYEKKLAEQ
jgi:sarcosine oxidase subunit beta